MKKKGIMKEIDYEIVPGTWAYELREHFEAFTKYCWDGFNRCCEEMREKGHENNVDRLKWREYVLWDMQKKHRAEVKNERRLRKASGKTETL